MSKRVARPIGVILVCLMAVSLIFALPPPVEVLAAGEATVNLSAQKQVIRGFGGMNHPAWIGDLTAAQRETAFGNGSGQLGFSILRIFIDDNKNNWSREVATAKKAIEKGALVFASPWNPPSSMIETFTRNGVANQKRLRYDKYAAYAQHLNDFVAYMKNNGVELYAISVQNEPDYAHDWTWWTPQEILNFMKNNAGSINCRVMAPESFQYLKNISDPILNDAQALANMDILGAHFYGTSVGNMPYPLFQQKGAGKELWMTEVYVPNSDSNSADRWPEALDVAYNMHNALVEGNFQAYVWWYIRRSYGPMKEDGNISKRGYMMSHYSKFVRPEYVRIDATKNPNTNVYISAYKGDDKVVIVAINRSTSAVNQNFILQNGTASKVSSWLTDSSRSMAARSDINVSGGSFTAQLPAQSVTTFVGELGEVKPPEPIDAYTRIEGESYDTQSGIQNGSCSEGGECVGYIENGDYTVYKRVDFGSGAKSFLARVASDTNGGNIEIRLDSINGTLVGTCAVPGTGGWQNWADVKCNVSGASGEHDLYLKYTGGSGYLFNVNWFTFSAGISTVSLGDLNSDGKIDSVDFLLMKKHILELELLADPACADLDGNGAVNTVDMLLLKQYLLGIITQFPA
ncbi:glucuronoarabinoxylan endo-1,4-beta-xylanase [Anaerobacterium chartisolvens]|uniref:Glucuronoarabinoxylan endo-1,4-beta-xylanase n=1 Tax=Anaerobacterium chartisolvens TaxID=1297424 RepID=A0A369AZZ0_9FIRM|nr:carbohydrate-binding protein [Anaerobacterium chartisolvens]RCX14849.1 glucuronoarabinoxylan endo-1,4-beta-xylanase [Anaerobacterium chartisolvens]